MPSAAFAARLALALACITGAMPALAGGAETGLPLAAGYAREWALVVLPGTPEPPRATLDLREPGRASGQAPCNRWFGAVLADLPALRFDAIGATRMACPALAQEDAFFAALSAVTGARLQGGRLVLTNSTTDLLEFAPVAP